MAFKSKKEIETLKSFVEGGDMKAVIDGSFADLKKLDVWELADRLESINNQSLMWTWMIAMAIRDHFHSDTEMGQFIKSLAEKNPHHPLCRIKQQHRNRFIHAARLCQALKITDINAVGISPTVFYKISAPKYKDFAQRLYHELKRKNLKEKDADRVIAQITAIQNETLTAPEKMDYDRPDMGRPALRIVKVIGNVAQDQPQDIEISEKTAILDEICENIEDAVTHNECVPPVSITLMESPLTTQNVGYNALFSKSMSKTEPESEIIVDRRQADRRGICPEALQKHNDKYDHGEMFTLGDVSSEDLILELATRSCEHKTLEEAKADFMLLSEHYGLSFTQLEKLFDMLGKWAKSMQA